MHLLLSQQVHMWVTNHLYIVHASYMYIHLNVYTLYYHSFLAQSKKITKNSVQLIQYSLQ
jgi:hypothetical protein